MTHPRFLLAALGALVLAACASTGAPAPGPAEPRRLGARPQSSAGTCAPGAERLKLSSGPDAHLYVPANVSGKAVPMIVFLHGAGGSADRMIEYMRPVADRHGFVLLVPGSLGQIWDPVEGKAGVDAGRIDEALKTAFERCPVDRHRLAIAGFSNGASYSLTLGLANGDLFSHIISFAPCGFAKVKLAGTPDIFIAHGRQDNVLSFEKCATPVVATLRRAGYNVRFVEFEGKHEIPDNVGDGAFRWFLGRERVAPPR